MVRFHMEVPLGPDKSFLKGVISPAIDIVFYEDVSINTKRVQGVVGDDGIGAVVRAAIDNIMQLTDDSIHRQ